MNRAIVDREISDAYEILQEAKIVQNGKIGKSFRGQIATLGAAITMGSLISAIAYFSDNGQSKVERNKLLDATLKLLVRQNAGISDKTLYDYVKKSIAVGDGDKVKEDVINALIAIKLAMNLYVLED